MSKSEAWDQCSRNLIVTRAGQASLHTKWLTGAKPEFDLVVTAYSPEAPMSVGEVRIPLAGRKVAGYGEFLGRYSDAVNRYDVIAFIDDDIDTDAAALNDCFRLGQEHGLKIWQPSLYLDSYFTYGITLHNPFFVYRVTDYVEMMCPFFTRQALQRASELFGTGAETGIDLVWSRHPEIGSAPCAVVDAVQVRHTRPVGTTKHQQGFGQNEAYTDQIDELVGRYGMEFVYPRSLSGRLKGIGGSCGPGVVNLLEVTMLSATRFRRHTLKYVLRAYYHHLRRSLSVMA